MIMPASSNTLSSARTIRTSHICLGCGCRKYRNHRNHTQVPTRAGLLDDLFRRDRERASADDAELKRASEQERDAAATSLNKITRAAFVTLAVAISANASSTPSTSPDAVTFRLLPQKNNGNLPTAARQELLDAPKVADPRATKAATKEEKPPSVLSSILQVSVLSVVAEAIGDTLQWLYYKRRLDNLKK